MVTVSSLARVIGWLRSMPAGHCLPYFESGQAQKDAQEAAEVLESLAGASSQRDVDWILAMGHALGMDSGIQIPIVPSVERFKELFQAVREQSPPPPVLDNQTINVGGGVSRNDVATAIDEAMGLVELPPLRVSQGVYEDLKQEASERGLVIQAVARERLQVKASEPSGYAAPLDPNTDDLVNRFAAALKRKLSMAAKKYGYTDNWRRTDPQELREELHRHVDKGDPRDVAAFCAFLWHRNESTALGALYPQSAEGTIRCTCCDYPHQPWCGRIDKEGLRLALDYVTNALHQKEERRPVKDHEIAHTVNALRDVALEYAHTAQLRERIAHIIVPLLKTHSGHPFVREEDGKTYFENGKYIGDILKDTDGYFKWWPNKEEGYLDEGFLAAMAKYLQHLNAEWNVTVHAELG